MNVCLICEASLSHHTKFVYEIWSGPSNRVYMYCVFHCLAKKKDDQKKGKKACRLTDFEVDLVTRNQRLML